MNRSLSAEAGAELVQVSVSRRYPSAVARRVSTSGHSGNAERRRRTSSIADLTAERRREVCAMIYSLPGQALASKPLAILSEPLAVALERDPYQGLPAALASRAVS